MAIVQNFTARGKLDNGAELGPAASMLPHVLSCMLRSMGCDRMTMVVVVVKVVVGTGGAPAGRVTVVVPVTVVGSGLEGRQQSSFEHTPVGHSVSFALGANPYPQLPVKSLPHVITVQQDSLVQPVSKHSVNLCFGFQPLLQPK